MGDEPQTHRVTNGDGSPAFITCAEYEAYVTSWWARAEAAETKLKRLCSSELRDFLEASVAVWREIDRIVDEPGGYRGLDKSTALRKRERAAWDAYKATLQDPELA